MSGTSVYQVRRFVLSALGDGPLSEAVLLQDLRYVGRKFTAPNGAAVWWAEGNLIEVFGVDGQLLQSTVIKAPEKPLTQAA